MYNLDLKRKKCFCFKYSIIVTISFLSKKIVSTYLVSRCIWQITWFNLQSTLCVSSFSINYKRRQKESTSKLWTCIVVPCIGMDKFSFLHTYQAQPHLLDLCAFFPCPFFKFSASFNARYNVRHNLT